jgi:ComF family protein
MLDWLLDLVAENSCAACDAPLQRRSVFCEACRPGLMRAHTPRIDVPEGSIFAPFEYGGPLADAIVRAKYAGDSLVCERLGLLLARELGSLDVQTGALACAVPLSRAKLIARGYNVPGLMLRAVRKRSSVPLQWSPLAVLKVRETAAQATLRRADRVANVADCFVANQSVRGRHLLLVDDVTTTGTTLREVMRCCLEAGATSVVGVALARSL